MNTLTVALFCIFGMVVFAAPPPKEKPEIPNKDEPIPILSYNFDGPHPDGAYSYEYKTGNDIHVQQRGQVVHIAEDTDALRVEGSYNYVDSNGNPVSMSYVADENGFQPKGDHLPTPPPIPAGILRALEYIAAHPEEDKQEKE